MLRLVVLFSLLPLAAFSDIKRRIVPDWMPFVIAAAALLPPEPVRLAGILAALPLFIAGVTAGGIGGGDIKLAGACGMALGFWKASAGLLCSLGFLLLFHAGRIAVKRIKKETVAAKGQAYPLVPFLWLGMLLSVLIGG